MKIKVEGIVWDVKDETSDDEYKDFSYLPDHVTIDTEYDLTDDEVLNFLADEYGFCVESLEGIFHEEEDTDADRIICNDFAGEYISI